MTCFHPLKGFENKEDGGILFKRTTAAGKAIDVACGQCTGCRIDKSKEWAARIVHESQMHQANSFVTLTYDEKNLPSDGSLNKAHFQKFMKRLRKTAEPNKIRYFHCGEYGETLNRPHYHACLFGIDFSDRIPFSTRNDVITYTSPTLEKIWGKGFATCGELNYQTAAYTARYIMKKVTGLRAEEHYQKIDTRTGEIYQLQPEYITMSLGRKRGQGIGGSFYEKYQTDFFPADECPIPGKGVYKSVPNYYERLLQENDPDTHAKIKRRREKFRESRKDEYTGHRLDAKEKVKHAQLQQLKRHL
uniref:rolling circle replication-associated protein n=1 Tax=Shewanella sp. TaxID=50422 RepID=UPI004048094F